METICSNRHVTIGSTTIGKQSGEETFSDLTVNEITKEQTNLQQQQLSYTGSNIYNNCLRLGRNLHGNIASHGIC